MASPESLYNRLGLLVKDDYKGIEVSNLLASITLRSFKFLTDQCTVIDLTSHVKGKKYIAFLYNDKILTRPLNKDLFITDFNKLTNIGESFPQGLEILPDAELQKAVYSLGMIFPAYVDLVKTNDKKTGGTFFEYLIGHIFAHRFGSNPSNQLIIPVASTEGPKYLPTDLIFDVPDISYGLHVPIKSTTRERVIQVLAHQRILDGVYGTGRYRGILVVGSETKLDSVKREVIEICLPAQWRIYQLHIAKLTRIYYLDPPEPYLNLNKTFPHLPVYPFVHFFRERITSF